MLRCRERRSSTEQGIRTMKRRFAARSPARPRPVGSKKIEAVGGVIPPRVASSVGQVAWGLAPCMTIARAAHLRETDCVAGHVRLELRNVIAKYPFERSHRFPVI